MPHPYAQQYRWKYWFMSVGECWNACESGEVGTNKGEKGQWGSCIQKRKADSDPDDHSDTEVLV